MKVPDNDHRENFENQASGWAMPTDVRVNVWKESLLNNIIASGNPGSSSSIVQNIRDALNILCNSPDLYHKIDSSNPPEVYSLIKNLFRALDSIDDSIENRMIKPMVDHYERKKQPPELGAPF